MTYRIVRVWTDCCLTFVAKLLTVGIIIRCYKRSIYDQSRSSSRFKQPHQNISKDGAQSIRTAVPAPILPMDIGLKLVKIIRSGDKSRTA